MSGTSLDGVDAVLVDLGLAPELLGHTHLPYSPELRNRLLALHLPCPGEMEMAELAAIELSRIYADAVAELLLKTKIPAREVAAIGCHGQTVRHRPELGYSIQLVNAPLLAELTGISVVSDFRNRDISAGGQGAPLVPAFHASLFRGSAHRIILNLGGIANLTDLPPQGRVTGFDCGPGNMLMDAWIGHHSGKTYDEDGNWASSGKVLPELLQSMLEDEYFGRLPPKSTGRDKFNLEWLFSRLRGNEDPADVQATLLHLTAESVADCLETHCPEVQEIYLCGGGARNRELRRVLEKRLPGRPIDLTDRLGIAAEHVEAAAFSWLAMRTLKGLPGNLPEVTGARGSRILGAIHPG